MIEATDRQRGIASLTLAFSSDPVMRWAWPDPGRYLTYWPRFAEGFGGQAFDDGTAFRAQGLPGCRLVDAARSLWPDEETVMGVMGDSLDDQILNDVNGLFEQMEELHPSADVWYLPLIGVHSVAQGQGLGSALLRHATGDV